MDMYAQRKKADRPSEGSELPSLSRTLSRMADRAGEALMKYPIWSRFEEEHRRRIADYFSGKGDPELKALEGRSPVALGLGGEVGLRARDLSLSSTITVAKILIGPYYTTEKFELIRSEAAAFRTTTTTHGSPISTRPSE
jgi:hypothetical protein